LSLTFVAATVGGVVILIILYVVVGVAGSMLRDELEWKYEPTYRIVKYDTKYRIQEKHLVWKCWCYVITSVDEPLDFDTLHDAQWYRDKQVKNWTDRRKKHDARVAENKRIKSIRPIVVDEKAEEILQVLSDEIDDSARIRNSLKGDYND
jgi:hypothetical protein